MKYQTTTEKQTINLGKQLAKKLNGGDVLLLEGDLGSGKTVLTKGIAVGLGIKKIITSPTFILFKVYPVHGHGTIKQLVHADAYRLEDGQGLLDAGLAEYLEREDVLVVIEWGEKISEYLQKQQIFITFKVKKQNREIVIK